MPPMQSLWSEIRRYVRFDERDEAMLREAAPIVKPHFARIVLGFYDRIMENEGARRALSGGEAQVARLKRSLADWLETAFSGPWDDAYFERRTRIGRVHVWIGLEPRYMVLSMHHLRIELESAVLRERGCEIGRELPRVLAIGKLCDAELAIMLEVYDEELAAQLKKRERLAALGQLGASISHEVRNPLGVITSSLYSLREICAGKIDERAQKHLERIDRSAAQASDIVATVLDLLRTREPVRLDRDWGALVREAAEGAPLPAMARVEVIVLEGAGRAHVDARQVGRVVANLVRNAGEAMPDGGLVTVTAGGDAREATFSVRDRGPGIAAEVLPHLFEPLFTTKEVGTGLGLALCKSIVEAHGGAIEARGALGDGEGGGAEFRVRIPRAAAPGGPP
jgi:signal transduction histidine kinase